MEVFKWGEASMYKRNVFCCNPSLNRMAATIKIKEKQLNFESRNLVKEI